jgi:hypothetical protein
MAEGNPETKGEINANLIVVNKITDEDKDRINNLVLNDTQPKQQSVL